MCLMQPFIGQISLFFTVSYRIDIYKVMNIIYAKNVAVSDNESKKTVLEVYGFPIPGGRHLSDSQNWFHRNLPDHYTPAPTPAANQCLILM